MLEAAVVCCRLREALVGNARTVKDNHVSTREDDKLNPTHMRLHFLDLE